MHLIVKKNLSKIDAYLPLILKHDIILQNEYTVCNRIIYSYGHTVYSHCHLNFYVFYDLGAADRMKDGQRRVQT